MDSMENSPTLFNLDVAPPVEQFVVVADAAAIAADVSETEPVQLSRFHQHINNRVRIAFDRADDALEELCYVMQDIVCPLVREGMPVSADVRSGVEETNFKVRVLRQLLEDARSTLPPKNELLK